MFTIDASKQSRVSLLFNVGSARKLTTWNGSEAYFQCSARQVSFITPKHSIYDTAGNSTDSSNHPALACQLGTQSYPGIVPQPLAQMSSLQTTTFSFQKLIIHAFFTQRLQKLIYLHLSTDCFTKILVCRLKRNLHETVCRQMQIN